MSNWLQLPDVNTSEIHAAGQVQSRFNGDPSSDHVFAADGGDQTIKEEKRLAGFLHLINYQVNIVPRGAYYRDHNMNILLNPSFKGKNI
jgi:radial spoke head protein 9